MGARVPLAGRALLQGSTFLAGTDQWLFFSQLPSSPNLQRGGREEMGSSIPTRLTPAVRSFWPCLVDLHSQHPVPTIHLTLFKQYQLYWGWATCQSSQWGAPRDRLFLPFPLHWSLSKDLAGSCSEELIEKLHPNYAPSEGSPKGIPEPHTW